MLLGIDDTDSPAGMCTTYLAAVLRRRLERARLPVRAVRLIRLNPNVQYKTRGNAAVALDFEGGLISGFSLACSTVEDLAELGAEGTSPGVVAVDGPPPPAFYWKAVQDFCEIEEAVDVLDEAGALYRGYCGGRGLIGATAAVASDLTDPTYEVLAYREPARFGTPREVDSDSLFRADAATFPHTWDTVDRAGRSVVCVPHTPDPVLFGIRGERPGWLMLAREEVESEPPSIEEVFLTNQGTDAHLVPWTGGPLRDGISYYLEGTLAASPTTARGGHVSFLLATGDSFVSCMAFEPTKGFRDTVRALTIGDRVLVCGSFKRGTINLEKMRVGLISAMSVTKPPHCARCGARMTSAGREKGYKCRTCGGRSREPEMVPVARSLTPGWYEVPSSARRHLARPLCRGPPTWDGGGTKMSPPATQ
ncbi:MAG: tRNA(Ile)(2)-agmatinylcytidine synthase [Methanomicrobiales archaeon]|nr:tRNA(Ile)(2)-agmatinylcytidine synthase [Methanomicrobiales archaeon]